MGYSDNRKTLDRIRPMLINLEMGNGDLWTANPNITAKALAYQIREALHIASLFPEAYPELARAAKTFKIQIVKSGKGGQVQAVLTDKQTGLPAVSEGGAGVITHGLEPAGPNPLKVMGKQTAASIIEHMLKVQKVQPTNGQFHFPEAHLKREEMLKLYSWCHKQTPPWLLLAADGSVTIARKSRDITEELAWSPEDE